MYIIVWSSKLMRRILMLHVQCTHLIVPNNKSGNNRQSQLTRQTFLESFAHSFDEKLRIFFHSILRSIPFELSLLFNLSLSLYCSRVVSLNFHHLQSVLNPYRSHRADPTTQIVDENEVRMTLISSNQLESSPTVSALLCSLFYIQSIHSKWKMSFEILNGWPFQSHHHLSLNAVIDYYASFFHALKQRSDRFSYGMISVCLFCHLYNGRTFLWTKKK